MLILKTRNLISNYKEDKEKIRDFFKTVYPREKKYEGCRQLWLKRSDGIFKQVMFHKTSGFYKKLENFKVNNHCDYYLTSNSFYANRRGIEYLFSMDNFVFDLDNHNPNISPYDIIHDVSRLLSLLEDRYQEKFPYPTAIVKTGRGVQIWIHIESISAKLLFLWKIIANHFCDVLDKICNENNIDLSIDRTASCNPAGLFRLPYSFNTKAARYITNIDIIVHKNISYTIDKFIKRFNIAKKFNKKRFSDENKIDIDDKEYKPLHFKRIKYIEDYVKLHDYDVVGYRNAIIFLYYNACVQVMERSEALERTEKLNKSFKEPYSQSEFKTVVSAVDKNIYKLTNKTFFEILGMTKEEQERYDKMSEYKPKIDKAERNKKIFQLAVQGETQKAIAEIVGCGERTVRTVLKNFNKSEFLSVQVKELRKTMTIKQTAEALNISIATVKRLSSSGSKTARIL
jgi:DNA-binding CsgD family transcriptional regulator